MTGATAADTTTTTSSRSETREKLLSSVGNWLTRTKAFKNLTKKVFDVCDSDKTGQIAKNELYAGILLSHVFLAKYAGPAACYPPSRASINDLFIAADHDNSGYIDEKEFTQIMIVCCGQITSRIMVYYGLIIFLVPRLSETIIDVLVDWDNWLGLGYRTELGRKLGLATFFQYVEKVLTAGEIAQKIIGLLFFFIVIPMMFDYIDTRSEKLASRQFIITDDDIKDMKKKKEDAAVPIGGEKED